MLKKFAYWYNNANGRKFNKVYLDVETTFDTNCSVWEKFEKKKVLI